MRRWTLLGAVLVAACGSNDGPGADVDPAPADTGAAAEMTTDRDPGATAELRDTAGNVVGQARFTETDEGVQVQLEVTSLPPGTHGVHVHETGQCDAGGETAFASAGGHLNPDGREHGLDNPNGPHAGDLPNIEIGSDGSGSLDAIAARGAADALALLLDTDGAAIMVHANADDMMTDDGPQGPGNSGGRIACGAVTS
jgi:superoxide dismutase, Cu-Zn family